MEYFPAGHSLSGVCRSIESIRGTIASKIGCQWHFLQYFGTLIPLTYSLQEKCLWIHQGFCSSSSRWAFPSINKMQLAKLHTSPWIEISVENPDFLTSQFWNGWKVCLHYFGPEKNIYVKLVSVVLLSNSALLLRIVTLWLFLVMMCVFT